MMNRLSLSLIVTAGAAMLMPVAASRSGGPVAAAQSGARIVAPPTTRGGLIRRGTRGIHRRGPASRPATREDIDELMAFLEKNSPNRYKMLRDANIPPDDAYWTEPLAKLHEYQAMVRELPKLGEKWLERFKLEDDLLALAVEIQEKPWQREELRPKVHDVVRELSDVNIAEQQVRVDRLKELLAYESKKFEELSTDKDRKIEDRTERIMRSFNHRSLSRGDGPAASDTTPPASEMPVPSAPAGDQ